MRIQILVYIRTCSAFVLRVFAHPWIKSGGVRVTALVLVRLGLVHNKAALGPGGNHERVSPVASRIRAKFFSEKESTMRFAVLTLVLLLGSLGLAGCSDVEVETEDKKRFTIFSNTGSPQPILLNQVTGETWRLTDSGWQRIGVVAKNGKEYDWESPDD